MMPSALFTAFNFADERFLMLRHRVNGHADSSMPIGNGEERSRVSDLSEAKKILDIFQSYGHNEVDT